MLKCLNSNESKNNFEKFSPKYKQSEETLADLFLSIFLFPTVCR